MTDHTRFQLLAAAAVDEPLDSREATELAAHLASCPSCRGEAAALQRDQYRLGHLGTVATLPATRAHVMAAARGREQTRPMVLLAAAALLVAALATTLIVGAAILRDANRVQLTDTWQALPMDALTAGASTSRIRAITSTNKGFFAVGSAGGNAAVWHSDDAGTWTVSTNLPGGNGAELTVIEVGGPGLIAAGRSGGGTALWFSEDGIEWSAAGSEGSLAGISIESLASGARGWLAVGALVAPRGAEGAILLSSDGRSWALAPSRVLDRALPPLRFGAELSGSDWLVMPAVDRQSEGAFTSSDGSVWVPAGVDLMPTAALGGLATVGSTVVGFQRDALAAEWMDGGPWRSAALPSGLAGRIESITVVRRQFVMLGSSGGRPLILRSDDGRTWVQDAILANGSFVTAYDLAAFGDVEVAVGIRDGASAIWIRRR